MVLGREPHRLEQEGRAIVDQLGGRWSGGGGMCRCPAHADRTPSLSVRLGRERLLLHCFAGCDVAEVLRALRAMSLLQPAAPAGDGWLPPNPADNGSQAAVRLWEEAVEIAGTPAADYLAARAVSNRSPELRFHPRTPHGSRPFTRFRPALLAAVRDGRKLLAVHRTFLDAGRRSLAALPAPRAGLGRFGGGAVRLGGIAATLGLAEGIETALSATRLFGTPCWATLGTERFGRVVLPEGVTELVLFLDHDAGGRRAEQLARSALAHGRSVRAIYPRAAGDDWNDVLRSAAADLERR